MAALYMPWPLKLLGHLLTQQMIPKGYRQDISVGNVLGAMSTSDHHLVTEMSA